MICGIARANSEKVVPDNHSQIVKLLLCTYHDQGEGYHDPPQQLVGDGVLPEGIPDGLIVTEETPFEGGMLRCEDEKRESNC